MKKIIVTAAFLFFATQIRAFLPQYYETAEVTPGKGSLLLSVAPSFYGYGFDDWTRGEGANVELSFRQGVTRDSALAFFGYAGGLVGTNPLGGLIFIKNPDIGIWPEGGFGAQVEFLEDPSLALQLSAEFPSILSMTFLAGIKSRRADREVVTFGFKGSLLPGGMAFVTIRPTPDLHLTLGASDGFIGGEAHFGIAYTFLSKPHKEER
jgi:hypothetical protein